MIGRVGQRYGEYRLLRLLGKGSFGEVYLGEHVREKMLAAVKVLNTHLEDKEDLRGFITEARTFQLKHHHIVQLLDFGIRDDDTPFLVMDYAPNGTLRQRHPKGSILSLSTIISYVKPIAEALQYAHEKNLIHRDVKPENMLLGPQEEVWLSDFGIAVVAHSTHSQRTEDPIGTVLYMAPEQIERHPTQASDQYALGIIVYEWISGDPPFGGTTTEIMGKHLFVDPPSLLKKIPTISPVVEQAVLKALAKDPQQRFASVQEFAIALEQASTSSQATTTILPTKQSLPTIEPTILAIPQPQAPDLDALYREGAFARSKGDLPNLERAASYWQQILDTDPNYQNRTLAEQMRRLKWELEPLQRKQREQAIEQKIEHLLQQAKEAVQTCDWQRVIDTYNTVLSLLEDNPNIIGKKRIVSIKIKDEAREYKDVATRNLPYTWMYEHAQQFVSESNPSAARKILEDLWRVAPYYGDPAGLAMKVRLPKRLDYEKMKASEARRVKQGSKLRFVSNSPPDGLGTTPLVVWAWALCLISGVSSTVGVFTQSWLWAVATIIVITILSYVVVYRKAVGLTTMIGIAIVGGAIACLLSRYTSTLHHNLIGQLVQGLGIGITISFVLFVPLVFIVKRPFNSMRTFFLKWLSPLLITVVFEYFLFRRSVDLFPVILGGVVGVVSLIGVICSFYSIISPRLPRDRRSDATLRSADSQAPTEPGTSRRRPNLRQQAGKVSREGVGNQLLRLGRLIFRRKQAQAQPIPGRAQVLPPPSYVLWAKRILIACTLLALLPTLYEYLQVRNTLTSATGTTFLMWSHPILGFGWAFLAYTIISWTFCWFKGHDEVKPQRKSIHEIGILALGGIGLVVGHLPFLFVLLNIRGVVSFWFMLMSFVVAVIGLPLCAIALRFVKEEQKKKTATEVPRRLWLQYLLPVIGFYFFSYLWVYRMTEDWPLALVVALGLALLGIGFVLWAWQRLYPAHKKLALVAMAMYVLGIGGEVTLLVAFRDSPSDVLMLGAIVIFVVLIVAGVVLIPVRTWKKQFLQSQLQQQNRTGVRRVR